MTHPEGATSTAEGLLQGALDAARAGYEVFPLKPEAKEPAVEGGFYAATRDEDQIREWWTGRYRGYAVGIATGRGSGLVVVDADDQETTKLVEGRLGPPDVRTKRGAHWYRQHPRDGRVVSGKGVWGGEILTKLDVKGDDALTEIPPSPGKTWANGIPDLRSLPPFPRDLKPKQKAGEVGGGEKPTNAAFKAVVEVLAENYPDAGLRHEAGMRIAGLLRRHGVTSNGVYHAMVEARKQQPEPITDKTLRSISGVVKSTDQKIEAGEPYSGGEQLEEFVPGLTGKLLEALGKRRRKYPHADAGNAERMVDKFGSQFRYVSGWRKHIVWDGKRWTLNSEAALLRMARKTARSIYADAEGEPDESKQKLITAWALKSQSKERLDAMIALLKIDTTISPDALDTDLWLLNVTNGTVDLRTGELREHDPADLITKLAPVEYDPDAAAPTWEAFLAQVLPSAELRGFFQRLVGYALTGVTTDHVLPFLYGTGSNGKTTIIQTLQALLGEYAQEAPPELLLAKGNSHPTELADLFGARLVGSVEADQGRRFAEALVKQLTGGDRIKARRMREDFWEFEPTHKIFLAANHKPNVRGTDHGFWRRIKLIPFTVTIPDEQQDKGLPEKLRAELSGILAWAVRGCLGWQAHGLSEPEAVKAATLTYRSEMDVLASFFEDECVIREGVWVMADDLWKKWTEWAGKAGETVGTQKAFGGHLTERGLESRRRTKNPHKGRKMWVGIELREDVDDPDGPDDAPSGDTHTSGEPKNVHSEDHSPDGSPQSFTAESRIDKPNTGSSIQLVNHGEPKVGINAQDTPHGEINEKKVHHGSPFTPEGGDADPLADEPPREAKNRITGPSGEVIPSKSEAPPAWTDEDLFPPAPVDKSGYVTGPGVMEVDGIPVHLNPPGIPGCVLEDRLKGLITWKFAITHGIHVPEGPPEDPPYEEVVLDLVRKTPGMDLSTILSIIQSRHREQNPSVFFHARRRGFTIDRLREILAVLEARGEVVLAGPRNRREVKPKAPTTKGRQ